MAPIKARAEEAAGKDRSPRLIEAGGGKRLIEAGGGKRKGESHRVDTGSAASEFQSARAESDEGVDHLAVEAEAAEEVEVEAAVETAETIEATEAVDLEAVVETAENVKAVEAKPKSADTDAEVEPESGDAAEEDA